MHYLFSRPDSLAEKAKQILEESAKRILSGETHLKEDDQYTGYNILQQAKRLAAADGKDWADVSRNEKEKQDYFAAAEKEMGLEEEVDTDAEKLKLFADNNLYDRSAVPVMRNLSKKYVKGTYDHELAKKLWKHHADRAAKAYGKEHGNVDGFAIFSPAIRKEVAAEFADAWLAELEAGNLHEENGKTILVYDKDGSVVQSYAPNNIGATRDELLTQAEKLAQKIGGTVKEEAYEIGTDELSDEESNKSDEIKSLEDLIKNPDPARIKQYGGGTKYVDMLRAKLDKLTNESSNEVDLFDEYEESVEIQEGKVSSLVWGVFAQTLLAKVEPKEVKKAQELLKTWGKQKDKFTDKDIADLIDKLKTPPKPKGGYFLFAVDEIGKIAEPKAGKEVSSLVWGVFAQTLLSKIEPEEVKKAQELLKIWGSWKDKFTDKDIADLIDKLKTWGKPEDGYFLYTIDEIGKIAAAYDEPKADWYKKKLARLGPKENIEISVQKMLDAEDREDGKFHSTSDMTTAFDENPEGSTSQLGDGVLELDGFNAAGWQHLDGKYAVRVGGGYKIYTDLEAAKAYAKDDF